MDQTLAQIAERKRREVAAAQAELPQHELVQAMLRGVERVANQAVLSGRELRLIADIPAATRAAERA